MKTYYAIQVKQLAGFGNRTVSSPSVLHEFESMVARDQWIAKGATKGRDYRQEIRAEEVRHLVNLHHSAVRHRSLDRG